MIDGIGGAKPECVVQVLLPLALHGAYSYLARDQLAPGTVVTVPLGKRKITGVVWTSSGDNKIPDRDRLRAIYNVVDGKPLPEDLVKFVDWVAAYTISSPGSVLRMVLRVPEALGAPRQMTGYRLGNVRPDRMTSARSRVIELLAEGRTLTRSDISQRASVSSSVVKALMEMGTLTPFDLPALAPFLPPDVNAPGPQLSPCQTDAALHLCSEVLKGQHSTYLIDGVTGSGKTEVYFEAMATALQKGHQVLLMMPEIALTTEFLGRFERRFKAPAAEWHSGLSRQERERVWRGVSNGAVGAVIGARSALFLPFCNLGLIVVDEEHDAAYKQSEGVIYHARDMAIVRAMLASAPAILVSATPSLETYVNAKQGKYGQVDLPNRHGGALVPHISLSDLRTQPPETGRWLNEDVMAALEETLEAGDQSLLFLNRRGYAPLTLCRTCGFRLECPACDSWLVEHRFQLRLKCHHCGFSAPVPILCPYCGKEDNLVPCGPGVERIVEEIAERIPSARRAILSSDHLQSLSTMRDVVASIKERKVDILVGTQLVAKGHHFPNLTFVGVVDADFGLTHGDLRASERCYQLLHQVSGRAGRETRPGRVLLQTHMPEHPVLQALVSGGRDAFLQREAEMRREAGLPPFGRLVALIVSAPGAVEVRNAAQMLARGRPHEEGITVLGPAEAPLSVVRGRHRMRFLIKANRNVQVQLSVRRWLEGVKTPSSVRISIDVDPQNFL